MAYSPQHNIAFIHIPKNAGKSIENALEIVSIEDQIKRHHPPQLSQFLFNVSRVLDHHHLRHKGFGDGFLGVNLTHLTYLEMRQYLNIDEDATWLACVRNPFTRMESLYRHHGLKNQDEYLESFENFVTSFLNEGLSNKTKCFGRLKHQMLQTQYLETANGEINPNIHILRYEELQKDFKNFKSHHNLKKQLEWHEQNIQKKHAHLKKNQIEWTSDTLEKVRQYYQKDFESLNYSYELPLKSEIS